MAEMHFEQGPIRPPSEAPSLLLRFTRNCPWNRCTFCPVYKGQTFSRRSLQEIKGDIDAVRNILDDLYRRSGAEPFSGRVSSEIVNQVFSDPRFHAHYRHVVYWHLFGQGTVFLQDANNLIMRTRDLVEALRYLRERVPGITRITSYARSSTLSRKSAAQLEQIAQAGLNRIHIGLESGCDEVLRFVRKATNARQHIDAGRKVVEAGMSLSEYVMPGLGGRRWSRLHAEQTAAVLNAIDPHFIRLRSLRIPPHTPLYQDLVEGRFEPLGDDEVVREIKLFIENLQGIHSTLTSDHIMNLLEEVEGQLPGDKENMLEVIDRYLALPTDERLLFRLGRRGGALRSIDELRDPHRRRRLREAKQNLELQLNQDLETIITELGDQYI